MRGKDSRYMMGDDDRFVGVRSVGKSSCCRFSGRPRLSCIKVCVNDGRGVKVRGSKVSIH